MYTVYCILVLLILVGITVAFRPSPVYDHPVRFGYSTGVLVLAVPCAVLLQSCVAVSQSTDTSPTIKSDYYKYY